MRSRTTCEAGIIDPPEVVRLSASADTLYDDVGEVSDMSAG